MPEFLVPGHLRDSLRALLPERVIPILNGKGRGIRLDAALDTPVSDAKFPAENIERQGIADNVVRMDKEQMAGVSGLDQHYPEQRAGTQIEGNGSRLTDEIDCRLIRIFIRSQIRGFQFKARCGLNDLTRLTVHHAKYSAQGFVSVHQIPECLGHRLRIDPAIEPESAGKIVGRRFGIHAIEYP